MERRIERKFHSNEAEQMLKATMLDIHITSHHYSESLLSSEASYIRDDITVSMLMLFFNW